MAKRRKTKKIGNVQLFNFNSLHYSFYFRWRFYYCTKRRISPSKKYQRQFWAIFKLKLIFPFRRSAPNHNLRPVENDRDIPVTPVHKISQVAVEALDTPTRNKYQKKDQERYSAIDRKIYKRNQEYHNKGILDRYHLNTGTTTSSGYSSSAVSAYSGADPVTVYSRDRIGKISKTVFDTEDYHQANQNITPEELRMPRKGQDWNHIWKSATADPKNRSENSYNNNAFRFNSP